MGFFNNKNQKTPPQKDPRALFKTPLSKLIACIVMIGIAIAVFLIVLSPYFK